VTRCLSSNIRSALGPAAFLDFVCVQNSQPRCEPIWVGLFPIRLHARRRAALDKLGERLLDANRAIGQPDKITVIFGRKITKHYRGKLQTEIEDMNLPNPVIRSHYANDFIKQYVRDHLILRTEPASNNVKDYGVNKAVENLSVLRNTLSAITDNYLEVQQDILETFINRGELHSRRPSTAQAAATPMASARVVTAAITSDRSGSAGPEEFPAAPQPLEIDDCFCSIQALLKPGVFAAQLCQLYRLRTGLCSLRPALGLGLVRVRVGLLEFLIPWRAGPAQLLQPADNEVRRNSGCGQDADCLDGSVCGRGPEVAEGLADKIAAGAMVAKWIAIKHHLGDGDDHEGVVLEGLGSRVRGETADGRAKPRDFIGPPELNALGGRIGAAQRRGRADPREIDDAGGLGLKAFKAKLPWRHQS
jgi:hypothetical protein